MHPQAIDSLDLVEMMMSLEETFDVTIPEGESLDLLNPRELVEWLGPRLIHKNPNKTAVKLLQRIAARQGRPELLEHINSTWTNVQIAAVVGEISSH